MVNIRSKRVYESVSPDDGFRVLADRLWPRGIKKEAAHIDYWAKDLAPSTGLRKAFHGSEITWPEFAAQYMAEITNNVAFGDFVELLRTKKKTTLLFAGKDTVQTHVNVLIEALNQGK